MEVVVADEISYSRNLIMLLKPRLHICDFGCECAAIEEARVFTPRQPSSHDWIDCWWCFSRVHCNLTAICHDLTATIHDEGRQNCELMAIYLQQLASEAQQSTTNGDLLHDWTATMLQQVATVHDWTATTCDSSATTLQQLTIGHDRPGVSTTIHDCRQVYNSQLLFFCSKDIHTYTNNRV